MAQITIRCINKESKKVKFVFPSIANNKALMNSCGFEIADPQYDAKMKAFSEKRPFIENGKSEKPVEESFATKCTTAEKCCDNKKEELLDKAFDSETNLSEKVDCVKEFLEMCINENPEPKSSETYSLVKKRGRQPGSKNKPKQKDNA